MSKTTTRRPEAGGKHGTARYEAGYAGIRWGSREPAPSLVHAGDFLWCCNGCGFPYVQSELEDGQCRPCREVDAAMAAADREHDREDDRDRPDVGEYTENSARGKI